MTTDVPKPNIARFIFRMKNMRGNAAIYELDPPYLEVRDEDEDEERTYFNHQYVAVSSVDLLTFGTPIPGYRTSETMIFPASLTTIVSFRELVMIPYKSHEEAFKILGYTIDRPQIEASQPLELTESAGQDKE